MTLTVNPAWLDDPATRARALRDAFQKLIKRIKRKYRYKVVPYLAVFERTKRGEPHLHVLMRCKWIDQRWLSRQMDDMIHAPIVDIRRCTDANHYSAYIAKYVGKDPEAFKGCKRYWTSRDWSLRPCGDDAAETQSAGVWEVRECTLEAYADMMTALGHDVSYSPTRIDIKLHKPPWRHWSQREPNTRKSSAFGGAG